MAKRVTVEVNDVLARKAYQAINAMAREANKKGGEIDLLAKLQAKRGELAKHIYGLTRDAAAMAKGKQDMTLVWFRALCKSAEAQFKEKEQIENVKERCPSWAPMKAEIVRGIETGLDVMAFDSYGAFIEARKNAERTERGARPEGNSNRENGKDSTDAGNVGEAMSHSTKVTAKLAAVVKVLGGLIPKLPEELQDDLAKELGKVITDFSKRLEAEKEEEEVDETVAQSA